MNVGNRATKIFMLIGAFLLTTAAPLRLFAAAAPPTIKVGAVISLTGAMASGGKDLRPGYEIAVRHINDAGGVFVKEYNKKIPIELIILDDESDAVKTA